MVDFEMPVCKVYLLFISADAAKEKEKKIAKIAAAHWCFKVCSPYSICWQPFFLLKLNKLLEQLLEIETFKIIVDINTCHNIVPRA